MPILSAGAALLRFVTRNWVPLFVAAVMGGFIHMYFEVREAHAARVQAELAVDSLEAVRDTTRLVAVLQWWDSATVYRRRAVQTAHLPDSVRRLNEQLGTTTRALARVTAQLDSVRITGTGTLASGPDSVPVAEFDLYEAPYRVWARVVMSDPPIMRMDIRPDPISLSMYVGCETDPDPGVTPAYIDVAVPSGVRLAVNEVTFHPEVCNPGIYDPPSLWSMVPVEAKVAGGVAALGGAVYGLYKLNEWLDLF